MYVMMMILKPPSSLFCFILQCVKTFEAKTWLGCELQSRVQSLIVFKEYEYGANIDHATPLETQSTGPIFNYLFDLSSYITLATKDPSHLDSVPYRPHRTGKSIGTQNNANERQRRLLKNKCDILTNFEEGAPNRAVSHPYQSFLFLPPLIFQFCFGFSTIYIRYEYPTLHCF